MRNDWLLLFYANEYWPSFCRHFNARHFSLSFKINNCRTFIGISCHFFNDPSSSMLLSTTTMMTIIIISYTWWHPFPLFSHSACRASVFDSPIYRVSLFSFFLRFSLLWIITLKSLFCTRQLESLVKSYWVSLPIIFYLVGMQAHKSIRSFTFQHSRRKEGMWPHHKVAAEYH